MPDHVASGPVESARSVQEAVCINTSKIFDSCRDKDCVDDLRVYPTVSSQAYIDSALSIRPRNAELLYVDVKVAPISFNRGYYTVDCTYFYRVTGETFSGGNTVTGLAVFDKRAMLFGSVGSVRSFSSDGEERLADEEDLPLATVDAVNPIALQMKVVDDPSPGEGGEVSIPDFILSAFDEELVLTETARQWFTTIGQFSILRLERPTQILVPAYDYCLPDKECPGSGDSDPCSLFERINFPVEEFFPPNSVEQSAEYRSLL